VPLLLEERGPSLIWTGSRLPWLSPYSAQCEDGETVGQAVDGVHYQQTGGFDACCVLQRQVG
jgi:hypothetical protein